MSPTVTTVVPAASTSPTSADFTSTTPSTGETATVSASCAIDQRQVAPGRVRSPRAAWPVSCSRRFSSSEFASAIFSAPRARSTCAAAPSICSARGPASTSAARSLACFSAASALSPAVAVLVVLRGGDVVVLDTASARGPNPFRARSIPIAPPPPPPCASWISCGREPFFSSASRASVAARSPRRCSRSAASVAFCHCSRGLAPAPVALCAEASAGDQRVALRHQLVAVQPRDQSAPSSPGRLRPPCARSAARPS